MLKYDRHRLFRTEIIYHFYVLLKHRLVGASNSGSTDFSALTMSKSLNSRCWRVYSVEYLVQPISTQWLLQTVKKRYFFCFFLHRLARAIYTLAQTSRCWLCVTRDSRAFITFLARTFLAVNTVLLFSAFLAANCMLLARWRPQQITKECPLPCTFP